MAGAGIHLFHQQWPPAAATPAPASVPPLPPIPGVPDAAARPGADEVRSIFITGLPVDVNERELHNLLLWLAGFEASQVNFKGGQTMGSALFSAPHAIAGRAALQDLVFDAETKSALHIEMAKKILFVKRGTISGEDASLPNSASSLRSASKSTSLETVAPVPTHRYNTRQQHNIRCPK